MDQRLCSWCSRRWCSSRSAGVYKYDGWLRLSTPEFIQLWREECGHLTGNMVPFTIGKSHRSSGQITWKIFAMCQLPCSFLFFAGQSCEKALSYLTFHRQVLIDFTPEARKLLNDMQNGLSQYHTRDSASERNGRAMFRKRYSKRLSLKALRGKPLKWSGTLISADKYGDAPRFGPTNAPTEFCGGRGPINRGWGTGRFIISLKKGQPRKNLSMVDVHVTLTCTTHA